MRIFTWCYWTGLAALVLIFTFMGDPRVDAQTGQPTFPVYAASHISTNTTTAILTGTGVLSKICINDQGASGNLATVYDNTAASGSSLAIIDTVTTIGCQWYDVALATGLTILTSGGTAADLTVVYRPLR